MSLLSALRTAVTAELPAMVRMGVQVGLRAHQPMTGMRDVELQDPVLPPVVLLHGFISVAQHMKPWETLLSGHATYALGYPSTGDGLAVCEWVRDRIERIAGHHDQPVLLVGHSLGGVILAAAMVQLPDDVVEHCVTVCSPHGPAALSSSTLDVLREMSNGCNVDKLTVIAAEHDWVVPAASALIPGAEFVFVRGAGHLSVVSHPRTLQTLLQVAGSA